MKIVLTFCLFLFSLESSAIEGVIQVLEAPIYLAPTKDSKVIWKKRKGEKIYIHDTQVAKSPYGFDTENREEWNELFGTQSAFLKTFTRDGREGYIERKFIKILYNDERELTAPENYYSKNDDPTDYRLYEPLSGHYPFDKSNEKLILLMVGLRSNDNVSYNYSSEVLTPTYDDQWGSFFVYANKVKFDERNRLYFGFMTEIFSGSQFFVFNQNYNSEEKSLNFGIGPYLHYDFFRTTKHRFSIGGGFMAHYHRIWVKQSSTSPTTGLNNSEENFFSGFSLSSKIIGQYTYKNIFKTENIDFISSLEGSLHLPYSLTSSTNTRIASFWPEDNYSVGLYGNVTFYLGIRANY